jgi:hypothetical protein
MKNHGFYFSYLQFLGKEKWHLNKQAHSLIGKEYICEVDGKFAAYTVNFKQLFEGMISGRTDIEVVSVPTQEDEESVGAILAPYSMADRVCRLHCGNQSK